MNSCHHQTKFGFKLPPKTAHIFLATAARHGQTPAEMSAMLVMQYLSDLQKSTPVIGLPAELAMIAQKRLLLLKRWNAAREKAAKGKLHVIDTIIIRWALQSYGLKISSATIYSWRKNFAMRGPAGLIDHRRWKKCARPGSASRQPNAQGTCEGTLIRV